MVRFRWAFAVFLTAALLSGLISALPTALGPRGADTPGPFEPNSPSPVSMSKALEHTERSALGTTEGGASTLATLAGGTIRTPSGSWVPTPPRLSGAKALDRLRAEASPRASASYPTEPVPMGVADIGLTRLPRGVQLLDLAVRRGRRDPHPFGFRARLRCLFPIVPAQCRGRPHPRLAVGIVLDPGRPVPQHEHPGSFVRR